MTSDGVDLGRARQVGLWPAIGCILLTGIAFGWNPAPVAQLLAAVFIACALLHAVASYGRRTGLAFFVVCLAITFTIENIGVPTGVPFGYYHFEVAANLPHVGRIPIVVGPLWFGGGYFSFVVAATLLDSADRWRILKKGHRSRSRVDTGGVRGAILSSRICSRSRWHEGGS